MSYKYIGISSVTIPESVTKIEGEAFEGCTNMEEITIKSATPPLCEAKAFDGIDKEECTLYVPADKIDNYKSAEYWNEFSNIESAMGW